MAGFDKVILAEKLIELGWKETHDGQFIPPDNLWDNKPESFNIYDAEEIQNLLDQ